MYNVDIYSGKVWIAQNTETLMFAYGRSPLQALDNLLAQEEKAKGNANG